MLQLAVRNDTGCLQIEKRPFSMDYRDRETHARGVYPTQDTSRMGTKRMK